MKSLMTLVVVAALAGPALAQSGYIKTSPEKNLSEVSITYSALRINSLVAGCGCFWMNGGSAELAVPVWRFVSGVAELSGEHTNHIPEADTTGLSLISGMAGLRISRATHTRFTPFAQGLVGGVHAFDSYFAKSTSPITYVPRYATNASSLAMAAGLGLDIGVSKHVSLRPIQAEYHYMQLPNGSTDQQHDVRLSAGVVYRFKP